MAESANAAFVRGTSSSTPATWRRWSKASSLAFGGTRTNSRRARPLDGRPTTSRRRWATSPEPSPSFAEIEELIDEGDQVIAVVRHVGRVGAGDVERRETHLWTFASGRPRSLREFEGARRRAGGRPEGHAVGLVSRRSPQVLAGAGGARGDEVGGRASKAIRPPSLPAPGPRSMIQSACAITPGGAR